MEIKEFGTILSKEMGEVLGAGYSVEYKDILKNNGVVRHALLVRKEGENIAPTLYLDDYYENYEKGAGLIGIVDNLVKNYRQVLPHKEVDLDFFTDFSNVSEKLFYKLVNYDRNRKRLKDVPYKRVLDLAMVPLCDFRHEGIGNGTITVQNSHLNIWEISKEELWENVAENAPLTAPVKVKELSEYLTKIAGPDFGCDAFCGVYVVTNSEECLGASACLYPGVLKKIAEDHESNLYIIPSSVHECLVIPEAGSLITPEALREIIRQVNASTVAEEEILSDNLYMYDREKDRFYMVKE